MEKENIVLLNLSGKKLSVGLTDIKFFNSDKYGEKYTNKVFIAVCYGKLFI
jgi:hypothetical protein